MEKETKNEMKNYSILHFSCQNPEKEDGEILLILPSSAGYFEGSKKYGKARDHIDTMCKDLAKKYDVYYVIFAGQDPEHFETPYSYAGSVSNTIDALETIARKKKPYIAGIIGMGTGGAIAVAAMKEVGLELPLILYNTPANADWDSLENNALNRDSKELKLDAPTDIAGLVQAHDGELLQIIAGNSSFPVDTQKMMKNVLPQLKQLECPTMNDVPIADSEEYENMINSIFKFLSQ